MHAVVYVCDYADTHVCSTTSAKFGLDFEDVIKLQHFNQTVHEQHK